MLFRHVGIVTQNIDMLKAFYADRLHLNPIYDEVEKVRIVKLKDKNGMILELLQYESMSENPLRKAGISHLAFTIDDDGNNLEVVDVDKRRHSKARKDADRDTSHPGGDKI